jgi:hypothetical protein
MPVLSPPARRPAGPRAERQPAVRARTRRLLLALAMWTAAAPARLPAQPPQRGEAVTVRPGTALRATPGGAVIGVSRRAIRGAVESVQGSAVRLTVSGFVPSRQLRIAADRTRGEVAPATGAALRATADADGAALADLRPGTYVFPTRAGARFGSGAVLGVRRALWVDVGRLERTGAMERAADRPGAGRGAAPTAAARATSADAGRDRLRGDSLRRDSLQRDSLRRDSLRRDSLARRAAPAGSVLETRGGASLRSSPGGDVVATLPGGLALAPLAREGDWVRVRLEGWVLDTALTAAGGRSAAALSAADLRADPVGTVGRLVRWRVESLAYQVADSLRRGLAPGEAYLLARGPGAERAVLYLALPDSLRARAQALPPLTELTVTARVRNGRSAPAGVPVLDLLELTRR